MRTNFGFASCRILSTYEITVEDIESVVDRSQLSTVQQPAQFQLQLPVVELMKVWNCIDLVHKLFFHLIRAISMLQDQD